jgi:CBS domain-containing protein
MWSFACFRVSAALHVPDFSLYAVFGDAGQDITTRVIARELKMEDTPVSKVMTRNPVFVLADTLAVEALQKMVQGL